MGNQAGRQIGDVVESAGDATANVITAKAEATIWESICEKLPMGCLILRILGIVALLAVIALIAYFIIKSNNQKEEEEEKKKE